MAHIADNLIAIVPKYKFERGPTFMLACDADGLRWLRERFLSLLEEESERAFMIGDDNPITSDGRFTLTVAVSGGRDRDKIEHDDASKFTWHISRGEAMVVAEKLYALLISNTPGHQYFGNGSGPYQTLVVTIGEQPPDLVRAMRDGANWRGVPGAQ
jgi:hypothetical protein